MSARRRILKLIHFGSTAWFVLCVGYILVLTLRQAGFNWWVIFSLSGYSALIVFLLTSLYLFAVFKSVDRSRKIEIEHPLSSTRYYAVFYDISPLLGGLAGVIGMTGVSGVSELLLGVAEGTLVATFLVWIIVDPTIGLFERLLPASREHRHKRLARVRALRQKRHQEQKRLMADIEAKEQLQHLHWAEALGPYAERLAVMMAGSESADEQSETEAVEIGVNAWQMGGLSCMRQLHSMAMRIYRRRYREATIIDYISMWWDGIGGWRNPSLG